MPQASFVILEERGVLAVLGPDRTSFLQGLVSNDVAKLAPDRALYAALLTAQGKYLHDFLMAAASEEIWLDGEAERRIGDGIAVVDPRLAALGARYVGPCETIRSELASLGFAESDFAGYDR